MHLSIVVAAALATAVAGNASAQATSTGSGQAASTGSGQAFPAKPVRIIIGFPPGGAIDTAARIMAPRLTENLGQQFVIDNRPGAGGVLGTDLAAKSPADGYTVFFGTLGNLSVNPLLYPKLPFDMARDFAPLMQVVSTYFMLYVHPALPVRAPGDLIALAKARPGQLNYSTSGNGGAPHLAAELFNSMAGIKIVHVPYKGSAPGITDLMSGQVQLTFDAVAIGMPHVASGRLRTLATLGPKRLSLAPDVPALAETLPGYEVVNWFGMVVPAATPRDIVARLHGELTKVLRLPDVREKLNAGGMDPVGSSPEEFAAFMKAETAKWARVIKAADIRAE